MPHVRKVGTRRRTCACEHQHTVADTQQLVEEVAALAESAGHHDEHFVVVFPDFRQKNFYRCFYDIYRKDKKIM